MKHYDTIIIGAGLAGLQCARLLGRKGLSVLLVDRKASLDTSIHTTGIFVRRTLEDFDLPESCLGPVIRDVSLYSPERRRLDLASRHDEFRVGRMGALYQWMREEGEQRGTRVWLGHRLRGARRVEGGVDVELEVAGGGARRQLRARYVIGADGARSRVAAALRLDRNRSFLIGAEDVLPSM